MRLASIVRRAVRVATLFLTLPLSSSFLHASGAAEEPLVKMVEKVRPAVVNINTERIVQGRVNDAFNPFFARYYQTRVPSLGSGVLISADGYIVTCAHVVAQAADPGVKVTLVDGSTLPAAILFSDEDADLALLKITRPEPFPFISTAQADLSPDLLGETVVAMGDPVGYQSSVSAGILSAKDRKVRTEDGSAEGLLQTDAAINPGNSGGALVDIEGKLAGICNAKLAGNAVEGIGFAIPGQKVSAWLADAVAIAQGKKPAPKPVSLVDVLWDRFGVRFQTITPDLAESFNLPTTNGLLVSDIDKGGPADLAGMQNGMVLVRVGNVTIINADSLPHQLRGVKKGDQVDFTIAVIEQQGSLVFRRSQLFQLIAR